MTTIKRSPTITVTVGGITVTHVLKAHHALGLDLAVGEATFSVPTVADLGANNAYWAKVTMVLSAGSGAATWKGYIVEYDYSLYPREIGVICKGYLVRAQIMQNTVAGGTDMVAGGTGTTDQAIVAALLATSGIVDPGAGNPPHLVIQGTGLTLGTKATQNYRWAEGQTALDYIQQLDAVCVASFSGVWEGYRTYDDLDGTINRVPLSTAPAGSPDYVYTEGTDIFSGDSAQAVLPIRNKIIVTGYDAGQGAGPVNYTLAAANSHIPTPPTYLVQQISSPLIEKQLIADAGGGLSCEAVATYLLSQLNQTQVRLTFVTPDDTTILLGLTMKADTPSHSADRLGYAGLLYIQRVERDIDEQGVFSQTITCLSGSS